MDLINTDGSSEIPFPTLIGVFAIDIDNRKGRRVKDSFSGGLLFYLVQRTSDTQSLTLHFSPPADKGRFYLIGERNAPIKWSDYLNWSLFQFVEHFSGRFL